MNSIIKCKYGEIDISEYPIIILKAEPRVPSAEETEDTIYKLKSLYERTHGKFVLLIDSTNITKVKSDARETLAIGLQALETRFQSRQMRTIVYTSNFGLRIILNITMLLIKPVVKINIFSNLDNAYKRAREIVSEF